MPPPNQSLAIPGQPRAHEPIPDARTMPCAQSGNSDGHTAMKSNDARGAHSEAKPGNGYGIPIVKAWSTPTPTRHTPHATWVLMRAGRLDVKAEAEQAEHTESTHR